jgi:hypothetical protein
MVVYACNHSTWEAEAGRTQVHSWDITEWATQQDCLKNPKTKTKPNYNKKAFEYGSFSVLFFETSSYYMT